MPDNFIGLYFLLIILGILIAYAGVDETLKLFTYLDLQVRYFFIKIQMKKMQRKLQRDLNLPQRNWEKEFNGK
jgi:hypothetical protein